MNKPIRLIKVNEETYSRIVSFGKYGDTMDSILKRIIDLIDLKKKGMRNNDFFYNHDLDDSEIKRDH